MPRVTACVLTVACAALALPASGLASHAPCRTTGKTVAKTAYSRIYRHGTHAVPWVDGKAALTRPAYFGCIGRRGKPRRLVLEGDGPAHLVLRSDYVAFTSIGADGGFAWTTLADVNLRTGTRMQRRIVGDDDTALIALVLTAHGSIAWSTQAREATPPLGEIDAAAFQQPTSTLDSGGDVDPASLTLQNGSVQWLRGGVLHTAPLVP